MDRPLYKEQLPQEPYLLLKTIALSVWSAYSFPPYGNNPAYGRSTLSEQLENLDNYHIRDCKLPTYIFIEAIKEIVKSKGLTSYCLLITAIDL